VVAAREEVRVWLELAGNAKIAGFDAGAERCPDVVNGDPDRRCPDDDHLHRDERFPYSYVLPGAGRVLL
jgi:hypothetical protein